MTGKRKRTSAPASQVEETSETASTDMETTNGSIPVAERVFDIKVLPDGKSASKKPKNGQWSDVLEQAGWAPGDNPIHYRINPARKWESMKKYKNFVVSNKNFGNGDYVYIYHGTEAQGANLDTSRGDCWVGKVLEIRAQGPSHVFLRVLWLYWPEELPVEGRRDYHATSELIASNLMEIMDAMTVTDKAEVAHVRELYDEPPTEGLFWRQKFDFLSNKLSALRTDCKCKGFHNPEKKLLLCTSCNTWLHEVCLLNNALDKFAARRENKGNNIPTTKEVGDSESKADAADTIAAAGEEGEAGSDTIKVEEAKAEPALTTTAINPLAEKSSSSSTGTANTTKARRGGKRKSRKSISGAAGAPATKPSWEGKLEARLEVSANEKGEEMDHATGKVIITDLDANGDGEHENFKEELRCLCCGASLAD